MPFKCGDARQRTPFHPFKKRTTRGRNIGEISADAGLVAARHDVAHAEAALTHEHAYYLLTIGLSHSHRPQGPVVPAHFMVGAMSLTQATLTLPGIAGIVCLSGRSAVPPGLLQRMADALGVRRPGS